MDRCAARVYVGGSVQLGETNHTHIEACKFA
jgi:hypothetical protein